MLRDLVSVVVPIYNTEKYLDRCINSIVNQTYANLEIILIDDESPDSCPQMCENWAKRDHRIKVVHKKNQGLGMARNTGIDHATGLYICFIDSDDYVALDMIEKSLLLAKEKKADIVSYGSYSVMSNGRIKASIIPQTDKLLYVKQEIISYILPNMIAPNTDTGEVTNLWMSMCGALFSTELFQRAGWRMVSEREIISEDTYSLLRLYKYVNSVAILPEAFYFYCENMASLTHTYKKDRYERICHFHKACIDACEELDYPAEIRQRLNYPFFSNTIAAMKMIVASDLPDAKKKAEFRRIIGDTYLQDIIKKTVMRKEAVKRKLLLIAMKHRAYKLCYLMIKIKT